MQKKKSGVKKCLEISTIRGGGGQRLMAKTILNFHFDYLKASLSCQGGITLNVPPSHVVDEDDDLSLRRI